MDDSPFAALRDALRDVDGDPDSQRSGEDGILEAAVSLILREGDDPALLFIKRAENPTDPWSGHMALPGGRRDPVDASLVATAVRETREETGVDLDGRGWHLGRLPTLAPTNRRLPRMVIHPFVFSVPADTPAHADSREVDQVHWVSLSELLRPGAEETVDITLGDVHRTFPCFRVRGEVVWGLTFRILTTFFDVLPETVSDSL